MNQPPNSDNADDTNNIGGEAMEMVQCEDCGHRLPRSNMALHQATRHIHRREEHPSHEEQIMETEAGGDGGGLGLRRRRGEGSDGVGRGDAVNSVDDADGSIRDEYVLVNNSEQGTEMTPPAGAGDSGAPSAPIEEEGEAPENHWSCPQCTLHNPMSSSTCEVCLYQRGQPQRPNSAMGASDYDNNADGHHRGMQVNITEFDPQAVGRVVNVASWSLFGALFGGPVGALVAGGTAAIGNGVGHLADRRRRRMEQGSDGQDGNAAARRPFFTVTTTSYSSSPWGGTTMSVTSNASGQRRTMTVRDPGRNTRAHLERGGGGGSSVRLNEMRPIDRQILQMMMANAVRTGAATPETAGQMSLEELMQQFGFPEDDAHSSRRRGATPEVIDENSTLQRLDAKESIEILKENQRTCNICLEEFKVGDSMRTLNHCNHAFHGECIDRWLSQVSSCPICKHELTPQNSNESSS